jgi:hypothetical protein
MKILCVLYDDPKDGMPKNYPLSELPELKNYAKSWYDTTHFRHIVISTG